MIKKNKNAPGIQFLEHFYFNIETKKNPDCSGFKFI